MVARTIDEVLQYLASFYDLPAPELEPDEWLLESDKEEAVDEDGAQQGQEGGSEEGRLRELETRLSQLAMEGETSDTVAATQPAATPVEARSGARSRYCSHRTSGSGTPMPLAAEGVGAHAVSAEELLLGLGPGGGHGASVGRR